MADAAVIFAAIVAFQHDAPWLGPLVVALLVGSLDVKLWGERAFIRMAVQLGQYHARRYCRTCRVRCPSWRRFGSATAGRSSPRRHLPRSRTSSLKPRLASGSSRCSANGQPSRCASSFRSMPGRPPLAVVGASSGSLLLISVWWTFLVLLPAGVAAVWAAPVRRRLGWHGLGVADGRLGGAAVFVAASAISSSPYGGCAHRLAAPPAPVLARESPWIASRPVPPLAAISRRRRRSRYTDASCPTSVAAVVAGGCPSWRSAPRCHAALSSVARTRSALLAAVVRISCSPAPAGRCVLPFCAMCGPLPWTSGGATSGPRGCSTFRMLPAWPDCSLVALAAAATILLVSTAGLIAGHDRRA